MSPRTSSGGGARASRVAAGLGAVALACAAGPSCARAGAEARPRAALAVTPTGQAEVRALRRAWLAAASTGRPALAPQLERLAARRDEPDLARLASVYLAWLAIDRADAPSAQRRLAGVHGGPPGTTHDAADVLEAALARRGGDPARALELLQPLLGKLLDPAVRAVLDEEIVEAALAAKRWFEAVAYLDQWLQATGEDEREAVRERVDAALARVPDEVLESVLRATEQAQGRAGWGEPIRRAVAARLKVVAVQKRDARLASTLLREHLPGDEGLSELAAAAGAPRVVGGTVGLLLAAREVDRPRAADALAGALDAVGGPSAPDGRLVARVSAVGDAAIDAALGALAAEGAGAIVAFGPPEGDAAVAAFATRTGVPVVRLGAAAEGATEGSSFAVGEPEARVGAALARALEGRGVASPLRVVEERRAGDEADAVACDAAPAQAGERRFPVAALRGRRSAGVLVLGGARCADDLLAEASSAGVAGFVALGLDAAAHGASPARGPRVLVASAGRFPLAASDPASVAWLAGHGEPPSFTAALAHDAARLVVAAFAAVGGGDADRPGEVEARHRAIVGALAEATTELWTTDARGFAGGRALARAVIVREEPRR